RPIRLQPSRPLPIAGVAFSLEEVPTLPSEEPVRCHHHRTIIVYERLSRRAKMDCRRPGSCFRSMRAGDPCFMRILHITPYFEAGWAYGGNPRVVSALVKGLARRGHDLTVCTTDACDRSSRLAMPDRIGRWAWPPFKTSAGSEVRVFPNLSNKLAYDLQFFVPV